MKNRLNLPCNAAIFIILIGGFGLRIVGINVGLPDTPDPRESIIAQDVLNLIHFTAPPETYNWPGTAWFYIIAAVGKLLSLIGLHLTETRIILLARCINTLLSTATLWFTYSIGLTHFPGRCGLKVRPLPREIGKYADNRRVGHIAAGLLAISMLHATNESRFALVDIPATFCVTLFLYLVARTRYSSKSFTPWAAIWLGITLGTGFAVKFTTVFVCLSLVAFIGSTHFYKRIATVIGVSALTFTLLCPYWVIDLLSPTWNLFFEDFWYEATHYHKGHFGLISTAESGGLQRFTYIFVLLKWGMGLPLAVLASLGVLCALVSLKAGTSQQGAGRREEGKNGDPNLPTFQPSNLPTFQPSNLPTFQSILLLSFVIPYLLFIGAHKVKFTRHLLILYPALTLLAAIALANLFKIRHNGSSLLVSRYTIVDPDCTPQGRCGLKVRPLPRCKNNYGIHYIFGKWGGRVIVGVVVLYSFIYTVAFAAVMLEKPTRVAASEWIAARIPPEEAIATAPVTLFNWLLPDLDWEVADQEAEWVLILVPDLEVFRKYQQHPEGYRDEDWYPIGEFELEETVAFYTRILGEDSPYELHKTFQRTPEFFGIRISDTGAPFPMRALAHPEILLYRRRN